MNLKQEKKTQIPYPHKEQSYLNSLFETKGLYSEKSISLHNLDESDRVIDNLHSVQAGATTAMMALLCQLGISWQLWLQGTK